MGRSIEQLTLLIITRIAPLILKCHGMYLFRIKLHESIEDNHSGTTITKCLGQREQMRKAKLSTLALGIQVKKKKNNKVLFE